jgi:hypothetical protein
MIAIVSLAERSMQGNGGPKSTSAPQGRRAAHSSAFMMACACNRPAAAELVVAHKLLSRTWIFCTALSLNSSR